MYNWRFLILAFLAALQPISSFSELNSVDGRGQCCEEGPTSLLQETRLSYGSFWQTYAKDNRLNLNRDISKDRRHEVDLSVGRRSTGGRQLTDRRTETDLRQVLRAPIRLARDDMRRAETREGNRLQRELTTVHRITSRDINRLERDRVRNSGATFIRANDERNTMESRRESRNSDSRSEFRNKENRETRYLLQRARYDVVFGGRMDQQFRQRRLSRSLERHHHRAREGVETRHELIQNALMSKRQRDSIKDPDQRMSRSFEIRDQIIRDRTETRHELSRNEFRGNTERDSMNRMSRSLERRDHKGRGRMELHEELSRNFVLNRERGFTLRISQSLERRDHRVRNRAEARDELRRSDPLSRINISRDHVSRASRDSINEYHVRDISPKSRVADHTNQRIVREKRSTERSSSKSRYQTRDLEQSRDAEMSNERRFLRNRQDTRVREESRSDSQVMTVDDRRSREIAKNRIQRSRSESRQLDQRISGKNDHRMYEKDVEERRLRSRSLHRDIKREHQPVNRRERERDFVNTDRDERRIARINARSFLDEKRQQSVDRRQTERNSVDRVLMMRSETRLRIRSSLDGNARQTGNRERHLVSRARDELRYTQINARGVRKSFEENRPLSHDRRERDSADRVRNERSESRLNHEQRDRQMSRTIRHNRQESRQQRSRESVERLRNIPLEVHRRFGYDDRELRTFDRSERTLSVSRLVERAEGRHVSRDFDRDMRINTRTENRITRNLERENYRFRSDIRYSENRDNFVLRYKTQEAENISPLNWQYLFYTLQAIYLCSIFAKVFTNDETGKKTRSTPWWTGSYHSLVKLD